MVDAKTPEQVDALKKRVREAVVLFEHKEGSRQVDLKEIPTLIRSLGFNPSGQQANMVIDQLATLNADSTLIPMEHVETVVVSYLTLQV